MIGLLVAVLLFLPLSAPFGEAEATASSAVDGLRLEVFVEVDGSPVAVVVRGVTAGLEELTPVALANQGDGRWAGIVELPIVENILLGFESIPVQGATTMSELHRLTELGVDAAVFSFDDGATGFGEGADDSLVTPEGARWGWLSVAAGAAALMLLALWTIGTVRKSDDDEAVEAAPIDDPVD